MSDKLAVTLWNFKGGVGKSTIALLLAEMAVQHGLKVLAVDLDEQQNLAQTLKLTEPLFPALEVRSFFDAAFADENFDMFIIDTHPAKDDTIKTAVAFADLVLIPVLADYTSIITLRSAIDYVTSTGIGREQVAIVKNSMTKLRLSAEVVSVLDSQGYYSVGSLPRSNILTRNIASGTSWDKSMPMRQRKPFWELYDRIWRAYAQMKSGNFYNLWEA